MSAFAVKILGVGFICTRIFKVCNRLIYWWLWRKMRNLALFTCKRRKKHGKTLCKKQQADFLLNRGNRP